MNSWRLYMMRPGFSTSTRTFAKRGPSTRRFTAAMNGGYSKIGDSSSWLQRVSTRCAALATVVAAVRTSSTVDSSVRSAVNFGIRTLLGGKCKPHPPVRDTCLLEFGTFGRKAVRGVEVERRRLRVQIDPVEAAVPAEFDQALEHQAADAAPAHARENRESPDLTGGQQPAGANWVTVQGHEHVHRLGVGRVPLVRLGDPLFLDEHRAAHGRQLARVPGPVGDGKLRR